MKIAIDAMGSDQGLEVEVNASLRALKQYPNLEVILYGDETLIKKTQVSHERLSIVHCEEVIDVNLDPVIQIRKRKNSSMVRGLESLKKGEADCFISAGSTGGIVAGAIFISGRIKGVKRPALSPIIPSLNGSKKIMLDIGANDEATAEHIYQNALLGNIYMQVLGKDNPRIGLLNIGSEDGKGNKLYKKAFNLISEDKSLNFVGNIEGRGVLENDTDVVVTDGFSGNVALKTLEGTALGIMKLLKDVLYKSPKNKLAGAVIKKDLVDSLKFMDYHETGGSIVLGVQHPIFKAHGSSNEYSFFKTIELAITAYEEKMVMKITEAIRG